MKKLSNEEIAQLIHKEAKAAYQAKTEPEDARGYVQRGSKYQALIGVGKSKIYLGTFETASEAAAAFQAAKHKRDELRGATA